MGWEGIFDCEPGAGFYFLLFFTFHIDGFSRPKSRPILLVLATRHRVITNEEDDELRFL